MTIFVYCPRGATSGGPEALHQLVSDLTSQGVQALLVPIPGTGKKDEATIYAHYECEWTDTIRDEPNSWVVVPEISVELLRGVTEARTCVWWLSIDNATYFRDAYGDFQGRQKNLYRRLRILVHRLTKPSCSNVVQRSLILKAVNCAQSNYAWSTVYATFRVTASMLTDYTSVIGDGSSHAPTSLERVAYNPRKGMQYTAEMIRQRPDLPWTPIENMTKAEVSHALSSGTVYLDFGHHPGKDRLPREAAMSGSVVLLGRRGSAAFHDDTPLPWHYKIAMDGSVESIASAALRRLDAIQSCLATAHAEQASYRNWIANEKERFAREVRAIFIDGTLGYDLQGFE